MQPTKIPYLTHTWNPVTGCSPASSGCANCWAKSMSKRFGWKWGEATCHPDRLDEPLRRRKPSVIGVCFMGDLFHESVPDEFIAATFGVMSSCHRHQFLVLTKRPNRMRGWFSWIADQGVQTARISEDSPGDIWTLQVAMKCARDYGSDVSGCRVEWPLPNVWLGVPDEDQQTADERIPLLLQTPAAHRFVSVEPMLGESDLYPWTIGPMEQARAINRSIDYGLAIGGCEPDDDFGPAPPDLKLNWVICGCESGAKARPMDADWPRKLRDQCIASGVPFFFKQAMAGGKLDHNPKLDGQEWRQLPQEIEAVMK